MSMNKWRQNGELENFTDQGSNRNISLSL